MIIWYILYEMFNDDNRCSAVAGSAAALYGPLHGGANEAVLRMLESIGTVDKIPECNIVWIYQNIMNSWCLYSYWQGENEKSKIDGVWTSSLQEFRSTV